MITSTEIELTDKFEIEVIRNLKDLEAYIGDWIEILKENDNHMVFVDPDWVIRWWAAYAEKQEMLVIMIKNNIITGICPLMVNKKCIYSEACFIGYPQASPMDFIIRPGFREQVIVALLDYLMRLKGNILINLSCLSECSPNYGLIKKHLARHGIHEYTSSVVSPVITAEGLDFEDYFKTRFSLTSQKKLNKKQSRLSELGAIEYKKLGYADIGSIFSLHNERWRKKIDTSGFSSEKSQLFFSSLISNDNLSFKVVVDSITLNQRLIAFQYGFVYNGRYLAYRSAFDELFNRFSLSKLLMKESIKECFSNNITEYDLGIGYEPYKLDWTDKTYQVKSVVFSNNTLISKLFFAKYLLKVKTRDALKNHRWIVLLRRNTLGEIRYYLSLENMRKVYIQIKSLIKTNGIFIILGNAINRIIRNICNVTEYLLFHNQATPVIGNESKCCCDINLAGIDDLDPLSIVMKCSKESIIKRFYLRHKCFIACYENKIIHYSWVSYSDTIGDIKKSALEIDNGTPSIYESFTDKAYKNTDAAYRVMLHINNNIHSTKYKKFYMLIKKHDQIMKDAAYKMKLASERSIKVTKFFNRVIEIKYKIMESEGYGT